jgi:hypothetical protein
MALVVSTPTGSKDYGPTKLLLFHLKVRDFSNPDLGKLHKIEDFLRNEREKAVGG